MSLENLIKSIRILSLSASEQEDYLKKIGLLGESHNKNLLRNVDELALQFEDAMYGFSEHKYADLISTEFVEAVRRLNKMLSDMSGNKLDIWKLNDLYTSEHWSKVRELAGDALNEIRS